MASALRPAPAAARPPAARRGRAPHPARRAAPCPRAVDVDVTLAPPATGSGSEPAFTPPTPGALLATKTRLLFALPWRRFKKGAVLAVDLQGSVGDKRGGRFSSALTLPQLTRALEKAAYDPRVSGVYLKVGPLGAGWAKLQEVVAHIHLFRASGKPVYAYVERGGEKEYYVASAASRLFTPPTGGVSLRGMTVAGTYVRAALDKAGVEPEVRRIGKFKSAGDQLLRSDMSGAQREQLTAILDDVHASFCAAVASHRGKSAADVESLLDAAVYEPQELLEGGWVDGLAYEDEVVESMRVACQGLDPNPSLQDQAASGLPFSMPARWAAPAEGGEAPGKPPKVKGLAVVPLKKYSFVSPTAFGLSGKERVAVVRVSGGIVGGSGTGDSTITAPAVIRTLEALSSTPKIKAVVLHINSGGGDALASDLMWRAVAKLAAKKPVVACMGDVAASGGYYIAMGAHHIVAQPLTVTGSIGVVTGKFSLEKLYARVGYAKTLISKGRYAEILAESRPQTPDEAALFDAAATSAYESFRDRAAASRGMPVDALEAVAQGRVWTGRAALAVGLVDSLGGTAHAVRVAARLAGVPDSERVAVLELSRSRASPLALVTGGASALTRAALAFASIASAGGPEALARGLGAAAAALAGGSDLAAAASNPGAVQCLAPDVQVVGASELGRWP